MKAKLNWSYAKKTYHKIFKDPSVYTVFCEYYLILNCIKELSIHHFYSLMFCD